MANDIKLLTSFVPKLDQKYTQVALTSVLDSAPEVVRLEGGEFKIPTMELSGLAGHNRANGGKYVEGDVKLTWKTYTPTYERNRKFEVDVMDNYETADIAFGRLSGVFLEEHVAPEIDAWRFATYAQNAGKTVSGTLADGKEYLAALVAAITEMEENEVNIDTLYLAVSPTAHRSILNLQTIESREVLDFFGDRIIIVPQRRFITEVELLDGKTAGQEQGGWVAGENAKQINFLIIDKRAIIQGIKHEAPKHIPAAVNQSGDGDAFAYRVNGVEIVLENKKDGIYAHIQE